MNAQHFEDHQRLNILDQENVKIIEILKVLSTRTTTSSELDSVDILIMELGDLRH